MDPADFIGGNAVLLALAAFLILCVFLGVRIVPQSQKHVVERFGRLRAVLGPGINFVVPFLDVVAHKISVLERQLPNAMQDAITADNVLVKVETSVFYRITEPEKTVYRIRDVDAAIATTVAGIVRSEIGKLELDQVQSNRADLIQKVREQVAAMVDDWGIEVTRAEVLDVNLDDATRAAMLQQLNAERARRALVTEAEGRKRAVELNADAELYAAEQGGQGAPCAGRCRGLCHRRDRRGDPRERDRGRAISGGAEAGRGADRRRAGRGQAAHRGARLGDGCLCRCLPDAEGAGMIWSVWWIWVVAGLLLGIVEILVPGFVFLGFAVGAVAIGLLIWIGLEAGLPLLLVLFALMSLAVWLALRRMFGLPSGSVKIWDRDINDN